ncbi:MAG: MOSC N-terminal beta barrel domain-containing protein [Burkholderiaceae bacterium]|nr:MOSC N-terminal beta barrel domain-containing protein [Burkholderiaceae bacterium]
MSAEERDVQGRIAELWVYPVKSCAGVPLQKAGLQASGLAWDRHWMVVDAQGEFLTQRSHPRMAWIRPEIGDRHLVLHYPGLAPLQVGLQDRGPLRQARVWSDQVQAWDMGTEAARWLGQALGTDCALVRFDPAAPRQTSGRWTGGERVPVHFADSYPLMVLSQAAIDDLNQRLQAGGHEAVDARRFRPNIVIAGLEAHDEDRVEALDVQGSGQGTGQEPGGLRLRMAKPCTRCPIPDIDPVTAVQGTAVGDAMRAYRQDERVDGAITFGMHAVPLGLAPGAELAVGQALAGDWHFA